MGKKKYKLTISAAQSTATLKSVCERTLQISYITATAGSELKHALEQTFCLLKIVRLYSNALSVRREK